MSKDYYEVLGVSRTASIDDIKNSYKKLAFEYHPDRNPDNEEAENKFKEINEAYQVLSDENKRAQYDSFGQIRNDGTGGFGGGFSNLNDLFGNLFEEVFTGGMGGSRSYKGNDLKYELEIEFDEAAFGIEKEIDVRKRKQCGRCSGTGAEEGGESTCNVCNGSGSMAYSQGFFSISQTCTSCSGRGRIITDPCSNCFGSGLEQFDQKVKVKIPAGVSDGTRLRMRGEGDPGLKGGPSGDLFILITVKEHPIFTRDGNNLYCELPVNFIQAILGDELEVPILKGTTKMKIPGGTQPDQTFRLKGKGIVDLHTGNLGDLYIIAKVVIPKKLNKKQKELLSEFSENYEGADEPLIEKYVNKLKGLLN